MVYVEENLKRQVVVKIMPFHFFRGTSHFWVSLPVWAKVILLLTLLREAPSWPHTCDEILYLLLFTYYNSNTIYFLIIFLPPTEILFNHGENHRISRLWLLMQPDYFASRWSTKLIHWSGFYFCYQFYIILEILLILFWPEANSNILACGSNCTTHHSAATKWQSTKWYGIVCWCVESGSVCLGVLLVGFDREIWISATHLMYYLWYCVIRENCSWWKEHFL